MKNKSNKIKIILIILTTIVVLTSITYAYFKITKTSSSKGISLGNLDINYVDGSIINFDNELPMKENQVDIYATKKKFSVENKGNITAYIEISITDITISESLKDVNFRYTLYEDNKEISTGNFTKINDSKIVLTYDLKLETNEVKNYSIALWINEDESNQNDMLNSSISGKITVIGKDRPMDKSGANAPLLASGMIPVEYDEKTDNWVVANQKTKWYDYTKQKWANAVTTSDSTYLSSSAGTVIPMEKINSMWVWIPRYKYKIGSNIGSSSNVTNPPEIDVVFENGIETTGESIGNCPIDSTTCYYTHPAFRNGSSVYKSSAYDIGGWDKELTGIWVGKFETGGDATTPLIKPDIQSLKNQNVSTQFKTSLKFAGGSINTTTGIVTFNGNNTYGLTNTTDTHMMKNTEWGAVAYLSQSKYGKYGNSNYTGSQKEVYINNSSGFYTGRSGGNIGGSTPINGTYTDQTSTDQYNTYGFYTYNDYLLSYGTNTKTTKVSGKGTGASTTGTIYGIYDMSGGAYEYTMSNWNGYSGNSSSNNSGFNGTYYTPSGSSKTDGISFPSQKYYDKYTGTSSSTITKEKAIKGDATYETMKWYSDGASFVYATYPWDPRGGSYSMSSNVGVFYLSYYDGYVNSHISFRSVLIP